MRPPSLRLTNGDKVILYDRTYTQDRQGAAVVHASGGTTYPAVVTRAAVNRSDAANATTESVEGYAIEIYTRDDPKVEVDDPVGWIDGGSGGQGPARILVAACDSYPGGTGAWRINATETGPSDDETGLPFHYTPAP
jgi:hypothetical protein